MGLAAAQDVKQLWKHYYSDSLTDPEAAALQLAIWEQIGIADGKYSLTASGQVQTDASAMLAWLLSAAAGPRLRKVPETKEAQAGPVMLGRAASSPRRFAAAERGASPAAQTPIASADKLPTPPQNSPQTTGGPPDGGHGSATSRRAEH